jgi:DNA invertase Pin-like site-specific DNA recombinase
LREKVDALKARPDEGFAPPKRKAVAYLRTSSRTNVGADKDSDKRQRAAIEAYARTTGYEIVEMFYDAAVSGADPVGERTGFADMATSRRRASDMRQRL